MGYLAETIPMLIQGSPLRGMVSLIKKKPLLEILLGKKKTHHVNVNDQFSRFGNNNEENLLYIS